MDQAKLEQWLQLFEMAGSISQTVLAEVHQVAHRVLTKEENEQVLMVWEDNRARARHNAGLDDAE